ncbi:MFS general substrate transporter [Wilcoxina mikolae CBS 423.85]|nr:MFS general substrate transporter [Wilcoxina mikolae CBS 423.85]
MVEHRPPWRGKQKDKRTWVGSHFAVLLVALDTAILATAIPTITSELHSISDVGWYGSVYLLTGCSLQSLCGKIYMHFSLKYTFLVFLATFELGSLVCATAKSSKALIVGRAISGMGSSGLFSGAIMIIGVSIHLEQRATYLGIVSSMYGIATITGPLLGGVITDRISWRWCMPRFYINLPIGILTALLLTLFFHPRNYTSTTTSLQKLAQLDLPGFILFLPSCVMLLLGLEWGASAMIRLKILSQRTVASSCVAILFQMGVEKLGYYTPIMLTGTLLTTFGHSLLSTITPLTPSKLWITYQVLAGCGRGMMLQMPLLAVQTVLPASQIPVGSALVIFCQFFGGTVFIALADVQRAYNQALVETFYVAVGAAGVAFVACLGVEWRRVKTMDKTSTDEEKN